MMEFYQIVSFFVTNGLRIFFGLYLVMAVLNLSCNISDIMKNAGVLSAGASVFSTILACMDVRQIYIAGIEIIIIVLFIGHRFKAELRMSLFLIFFYEVTVALWEFLVSAGLGILFRLESFPDMRGSVYMAAVWIVRALMSGIAVFAVKAEKGRNRILSAIAVAGLFGAVFLSGQNILPIEEEQITTWIIFSMLILVAVLFFHLSRQYEMEKKISYLEKEKNELLMRDYTLLKNTYAANAKLFHDFHNHMEALYRYLEKDQAAEAARYLDDLRPPVEAVAQPVRTGDEAVDYLLGSKIAFAASRKIQVKCNIEFPQHTNIRSVDLVTILGNLLDNALEAVEDTEGDLRFIRLTIRRIHEMLIIKLENGCRTAPAIEDGALKTIKADVNLHGWGLKSVRTTAERYDGTVETEYGNNRFCIVVTLSYEPIKAE